MDVTITSELSAFRLVIHQIQRCAKVVGVSACVTTLMFLWRIQNVSARWR